jgi:hypothetical protein
MPSTVYKGDLAEVTFGHESGLYLRSAASVGHATTGSPQTFTWAHTAVTGNTSTITFSGGILTSPVIGNKLQYPEGLLVGSTLTFISSANFASDDYADSGQIFTIVGNAIVTGSTVLTLSPSLKTAALTVSATNDAIYIHSLGTPTIDVGMTHHANADQSDETVLTDQFMGLAATVVLPDTKNEIKRSHVVGIGRDVVVQVAGKQTNEGGSMELMMNSPRWLYYCLGAEAIKAPGATYQVGTSTTNAAASAGDSYIDVTALASAAIGDYIAIEDTDTADMPTDIGPTNTWSQYTSISYNKTETNEIRRIVGISDGTAHKTFWLDDPLCFSHDTGKTFRILQFSAGSTNGPDVNKDTVNITNPTERLIYSNWSLPTFAVETSIRTRNIGSHRTESGASIGVPGSANDAKTLTRLFKGCKVKDFTLAADADSEVKLTINYDALQVYTDTGRKEALTKGDRYTAHRMFENTADSAANRKVAGIAPYTQKPYLYYNGEIKAFGQTIARATKFNLNGKNHTTQHWVIRGSDLAMNNTTDQVPYLGTRMPTYAVEGKMEYELSMELIIDDPLLWEEVRFAKSHDYVAPITLTLIKQGSGATRERIEILIDDYIMAEAPLPIPEDKGVIRTDCKILPKHMSVKSIDTLFHC